MTTPTGHQDFQDIVQWRGGAIASQAFNVVNNNPLQINGVAGNFASLQMKISAGNLQGFTAQLFWFADAAHTQLIDVQNWVLFSCALRVVTPILGPYFQININTTAVTNQSGSIFAYPTNVSATKPTYQLTSNSVTKSGLSVPASGTQQFVLPEIAAGQLSLSTLDVAASGHITAAVNELDATGAVTGPAIPVFTTAGSAVVNSLAHECPLRLDLANTDAGAAHTVSARLVVVSQ